MKRQDVFAALAVCVIAGGAAWAEDKAKDTADVTTAEGTQAAADAPADEMTDAAMADLVADVEAGEALYRKECRACHGPTAKGVSSYPRLVGQPVEYLVEKLERYRAGEKLGPNTMLMAPRAKKLSDQDIANLTGFIASLPAE